MANEQNLIPGAHPLSVQEQSKGGIASGQARRIKSRKRKLVLDLLALRQPDEKVIEDLRRFGVDTDDLTNEVTMHLRQIDKAVKKGDTNAYNAVLKAAGILTDDINVRAEGGINIAVGSPEVADALDKVLKGGAKPRDPETE